MNRSVSIRECIVDMERSIADLSARVADRPSNYIEVAEVLSRLSSAANQYRNLFRQLVLLVELKNTPKNDDNRSKNDG